MNTQLLTGICIVLGGLGAWNSWTLYQVNKRLDFIEQGKASVIERKTIVNHSESAPYQVTSQKISVQTPSSRQTPQNTQVETSLETAKSAIDLSDPNIQEAIAQIAENNAQQNVQNYGFGKNMRQLSQIYNFLNSCN